MSKNLSDIFPPTEIGGGGGGIEEAPKTGKLHARKDGAWEEFDPGQLETGNQDGEILTWDTATAKWVDNDTMIVKGGNVGIGEQDPQSALTVKTSNWLPVKITRSNCQVGIGLSTIASGGWGLYDVVRDDYELFMKNGYVGIGTTSPSTKLHIEGDDVGSGSGEVAIRMDVVAATIGARNEIRSGVTNGTNPYMAFAIRETGSPWASVERMRIDAQGRVGIGIQSMSNPLHVGVTPNSNAKTSGSAFNGAAIRLDGNLNGTGVESAILAGADGNLSAGIGFMRENDATWGTSVKFYTHGPQATTTDELIERMRIDAQGRVGIGGTPSRSTKEIEEEAEATLRNWDTKDKKPTKAELIKQLTERTIGGGTAKLQVAGDVFAQGFTPSNSGNSTIKGIYGSSVHIDTGHAVMLGRSGTGAKFVYFDMNNATPSFYPSDGYDFDIGRFNRQFKDAHFSGTVNATTINGKVTDVPDHVKAITPTQIANWDAGTGGGGGGATTDGRISDTQIIHWDQAYGWGNHATAGYSKTDTTYTAGNGLSLSGNQFTMSGSYTGNFTATGNITAYSDERLKDSVKTAPSGLVDQLRGVEFNWKESGKADAGVIAQEVEQVLPHLVADHEDGMKSVNYNGLVAYLIEEVKALRAEVEALKG